MTTYLPASSMAPVLLPISISSGMGDYLRPPSCSEPRPSTSKSCGCLPILTWWASPRSASSHAPWFWRQRRVPFQSKFGSFVTSFAWWCFLRKDLRLYSEQMIRTGQSLNIQVTSTDPRPWDKNLGQAVFWNSAFLLLEGVLGISKAVWNKPISIAVTSRKVETTGFSKGVVHSCSPI